MATVRLSSNRTLPVRRYVNPPILVGEGWTDHEVTEELGRRLLSHGRGRVVVHREDIHVLQSVGVNVVDNEFVSFQPPPPPPPPEEPPPPPPPGKKSK